jgi:hypothetical protein
LIANLCTVREEEERFVGSKKKAHSLLARSLFNINKYIIIIIRTESAVEGGEEDEGADSVGALLAAASAYPSTL